MRQRLRLTHCSTTCRILAVGGARLWRSLPRARLSALSVSCSKTLRFIAVRRSELCLEPFVCKNDERFVKYRKYPPHSPLQTIKRGISGRSGPPFIGRRLNLIDQKIRHLVASPLHRTLVPDQEIDSGGRSWHLNKRV